MAMQQKAVLFWDFDGTLVYSNQSFLESLEKAVGDGNPAVTPQQCKEFLQSACSWNCPQRSFPERTGEAWWQDLLEKLKAFLEDCNIQDPEAICTDFRRYASSYSYRLYEDAREVLQEIRARGYPCYLLSSNFPELRETVKNLALTEFFTDICLSSELGYEKPREELFRLALEKAGNPELAWMIGDNPVSDIQGAARAGLHTILVHPRAACPEAEYACRTLREILDIL